MKQNNKDLTKRTPGETAWLVRKVLELTQVEMAARLGVTENVLIEIEKDRRPSPVSPKFGVQTASPELLLALARRRSGLTLEAVAEARSVSKVTVHAWEAAADPRLVSFWEKRGFRFGR